MRLRWSVAKGVFLLALGVRLAFIFLITEPDNPGVGPFIDSFHRWQIAYLTREIGWKQGGRLWDLQGFEYLWGVVHPFLLNILFSLFGRVDMWVSRVLSALAGSGSAVLFYGLGKRWFNHWVGLGVGLFVIFCPFLILIDSSGYVEPLGVLWLLLGVWFWPKKPFFTGIFLGLGAMTRIEVWVLGLGVLGLGWLFKKTREKWFISLTGWLMVMVGYMKYLLARTGSAIYPLQEYWLEITEGKWGVTVGRSLRYYLNTEMFWGMRYFYLLIGGLGFLGAIWLFRKKPRRFWMGLWLGLLVVIQLIWRPIMRDYRKTDEAWQRLKQVGKQFGQVYDGRGRVLIPSNAGDLTYVLVKYGKLEGKNIVGQGFDVFHYLGKDVSNDQVVDWLKKEKIGWLMLGEESYRRVIEEKADDFSLRAELRGYEVYQVDLD